MTRKEFLKAVAGIAGSVVLLEIRSLFGGERAPGLGSNEQNKTHENISPRIKGNDEEQMKSDLSKNIEEMETYLTKCPGGRERLGKYLKELRDRLISPCDSGWLLYQSNRLDRIRWLFDKSDDGKKKGMHIMMRPYDIPWIVWAVASKDTKAYIPATQQNGVVENAEKMLKCPDVEIEFTDKFADFCYLCRYMAADGCTSHPEYGGYGKVFPQPVQMSDSDRKESELALDLLGLKWRDVVTAKNLLSLCAEKVPDPLVFSSFAQLSKNDCDLYKTGITKLKEWEKTLE